MSVPFGEAAVLNDGRRVVAPWLKRGIYIGDRFVDGPVLLCPDAAIDGQGHVWVAGLDAQTNAIHVTREGAGAWWTLPVKGFGRRVILRVVAAGCQVALTTTAYAWAVFEVAATGVVRQVDSGAIPSGEGGHGMRGWDAAGKALPMAPLDETIAGHRVRARVTVGEVAIACGLFDPPQAVLLRGGALGTLALGDMDWPTPRISANGQYWVGARYNGEVMLGGRIPATVPPLNATAPAPSIAPFTFPTAIAWFFEDSKRPSVKSSPAPGQWSLIVESGLTPTKPVIIGLSGDNDEDLIAEWAGRWSQVRGIYVADEASRAGLQTKARLARSRMLAHGLPHRTIYSYSAGKVWTDIPEIDVLGVQCYPEPGETIGASEHRWGNLLQPLVGRRLALVCGVYDRRPLVGITEAQLGACLPVYARLMAAVKAEAGLMFAWGREGGASAYPSLWPGLKALAGAVRTLPAVEDDHMHPPRVTVTRFDGKFRPDGWHFTTTDGNGQTIDTFTKDGVIHQRITNALGFNEASDPKRRIA